MQEKGAREIPILRGGGRHRGRNWDPRKDQKLKGRAAVEKELIYFI